MSLAHAIREVSCEPGFSRTRDSRGVHPRRIPAQATRADRIRITGVANRRARPTWRNPLPVPPASSAGRAHPTTREREGKATCPTASNFRGSPSPRAAASKPTPSSLRILRHELLNLIQPGPQKIRDLPCRCIPGRACHAPDPRSRRSRSAAKAKHVRISSAAGLAASFARRVLPQNEAKSRSLVGVSPIVRAAWRAW